MKFLFSILLIASIVLAILGVCHAVPKLFTLDEAQMVRAFTKLTTMGPAAFHPVPEGGGEELSHPLLYDYFNALLIWLWGPSELVIRGAAVFFYFLSLLALILFILWWFRDHADIVWLPLIVAISLYLINPLILQHSVLVNGDNSILAVTILLFVCLFVYFEIGHENIGYRSRFILAGILAFGFLTKELTPIFLSMSVIIYRLLNRQWRRGVLDTLITLGLGFGSSLLIWLVYCRLSHTDPMAFIKFRSQHTGAKINLAFVIEQVRNMVLIWKWPWYWLSAPFWILVFGALGVRVVRYCRVWRCEPEDFFLISGLLVFLPYQFFKPSYDVMKYQHPAIPLFIIGIVLVVLSEKRINALSRWSLKNNVWRIGVLAMLLCGAGSWYFLRTGDYIVRLWSPLNGLFLAAYYVPIILILLGGIWLLRENSLNVKIPFLILLCVYPINGALMAQQMQPYTTASTWLNYGERGFRDVVDYLGDHVQDKEFIFARKDIVYYLVYRKGLEVNCAAARSVFTTIDIAPLREFFEEVPIHYFVYDRISVVRILNPAVKELLNEYFVVEKICGDFIVLRHKKSPVINVNGG